MEDVFDGMLPREQEDAKSATDIRKDAIALALLNLLLMISILAVDKLFAIIADHDLIL